MMEFRVRSKRSDEFMNKFKGSQVQQGMIAAKLEGAARLYKPNGDLLLVYLPGAVKDLSESMWEDFSSIRLATSNRGYASGAKTMEKKRSDKKMGRVSAPTITSSILGTIDMDYRKSKEVVCRLTTFTAREVEKWDRLLPMFDRIAERFEKNVPDRYTAQVAKARVTEPEWVIKGTPFTTITVNNTYPTGIHTDKGDLDEGFSTLAVLRRGMFEGGWLTFPQYGVTVDMKDGDLLLMDAHEWHGNTPLLCSFCGESLRKYGHRCENMVGVSPERVSIVSYYRTEVEKCGTDEEEIVKREMLRDENNARALGLEYGEI